MLSRSFFFYLPSRYSTHTYIYIYITSAHLLLPIVARKFIRKILAAVAALWRMRFRWCTWASGEVFAGERGRRHITKPTPTDEGMVMLVMVVVQSRARSITHPPLHLLSPVCQSRHGVIGDAECANCRRSTTRIYRATRGDRSRCTRVRIKAHLGGTIVNAQSIEVTTPLMCSPDIPE